MIALRVLGIGSPFGDDQLGREVIKLLQQQKDLLPYIPQDLELTYCDRPGIYLLELMRNAHCVFLIDAIQSGAATGTIHCFKNKEIEQIEPSLSTHSIGIAEAMLMGSALHALPQHVILYGLEIGEVLCEFGLTRPIIDAIHTLSIRIAEDILLLLSSHR